MHETDPQPNADPVPQPDPDRPATYLDDGPAESNGQPGAAMANQFLSRAYFTRLHLFCDRPDEHPTRAKVCFVADFVLRAAAALLILMIAAVAAWKSLSPLPWQ